MGGLIQPQQRPAQASEQPESAPRGPFGPGGPFARSPGQPSVGFVVRPRRQSVAHISVLLGIILAMAGAGYIFKAWDLLFASDGVVAGAGYTDIHAALPGMRIMMVSAGRSARCSSPTASGGGAGAGRSTASAAGSSR